jgi:hypothetical protein
MTLFEQIRAQGFEPSSDDAEDELEENVTLKPPPYAVGEFPSRNKLLQYHVGGNWQELGPVVEQPSGKREEGKGANLVKPVDPASAQQLLARLSAKSWADQVEEEEEEAQLAPPPQPVRRVVEKAAVVAPVKVVQIQATARVPPDLERREAKAKAYREKVAEMKRLRAQYAGPQTAKGRKELKGKGSKVLNALRGILEEEHPLEDKIYRAWDAYLDAWDDDEEFPEPEWEEMEERAMVQEPARRSNYDPNSREARIAAKMRGF